MHARSPLFVSGIAIALLSIGTALAGQDGPAATKTNERANTDVRLERPTWQALLDKLFGAPNDGLLDGDKRFQLRADGITLTKVQSTDFLAASSTQNLVELIKSAELLRGQIRLDGMIDGEPFHLKLEGRELKIEGLSLTAEQREALVAELRGISGLREAKIEALVDGKRTVTKLEGDRREKFEIRDRDRGREDRPDRDRGDDDRRSGELRHGDDTGRTANAEIRERVDRSGPGRDGVERTESSGRR